MTPGGLFKFITQFWTPMAVPSGGAVLGTNGPQAGWSINFGDKHVSIRLDSDLLLQYELPGPVS